MSVPKLRIAAIALCLAVSALPAAEIPRRAQDLGIQFPGQGESVRLSKYKGKVVALLFILTTCPHCQNAVRALSAEQNQLGPRGFQALASAIDETAQANLPNFIREFKPPFPVGVNNVMAALDFMQHPPMVGPRMPLIAFIDRQGFVRAQFEGQEPFFAEDKMAANIHAKLLDMLKSDAKASPKKAPSK